MTTATEPVNEAPAAPLEAAPLEGAPETEVVQPASEPTARAFDPETLSTDVKSYVQKQKEAAAAEAKKRAKTLQEALPRRRPNTPITSATAPLPRNGKASETIPASRNGRTVYASQSRPSRSRSPTTNSPRPSPTRASLPPSSNRRRRPSLSRP